MWSTNTRSGIWPSTNLLQILRIEERSGISPDNELYKLDKSKRSWKIQINWRILRRPK